MIALNSSRDLLFNTFFFFFQIIAMVEWNLFSPYEKEKRNASMKMCGRQKKREI